MKVRVGHSGSCTLLNDFSPMNQEKSPQVLHRASIDNI